MRPVTGEGHALGLGGLAFSLLAAGCLVDFDRPISGDGGARCGNGMIEVGEDCDGENLAGRTCADYGFASGSVSCLPSCELDLYDCVAGCGNALRESGELCDDGRENSDTAPDACRADCTLPGCGDGVADSQEHCDGDDLAGLTCESLGLGNGTLTCRADCHGVSASGCAVDGICGNGVLDSADEVCDGSALGGETCESLGLESGTLGCRPDCQGHNISQCSSAGDFGPCTTNEQCLGGLCWTEAQSGYPGGMCTRDCGETSCPEGACAELFGARVCMRSCADPGDCRLGYGCFDPFALGETFCYPRCESDTDCLDTGLCNLYLGLCTSTGTGRLVGAACITEGDCEGAICWSNPTGGYCSAYCRLSVGFCPGDGVCADFFNGARGDLGFCLDGCVTSNDCYRTGYSCKPNVYGGHAGGVCLD